MKLYHIFLPIFCLLGLLSCQNSTKDIKPEIKTKASIIPCSPDEFSENLANWLEQGQRQKKDSLYLIDSLYARCLMTNRGGRTTTDPHIKIKNGKKALNIWEKWLDKGKKHYKPYILNWMMLAGYHRQIDEIEASLEAMRYADSLWTLYTPNDYERKSHIEESWGYLLTNLDQYEASKAKFISNAKYRLLIHKSHREKKRRDIAWMIGVQGWPYENLDEHDKAIEFVRKGIAYVQPSQGDWERGDSIGLGICYDKLGEISWKEGNYQEALAYARKSHAFMSKGHTVFQTLNRLNSGEASKKVFYVPYDAAWNYSLWGDIYQSLGKNDSAILLKEQARQIFDEYNSPRDIAVMNRFIGGIYAAKGEYERALQICMYAKNAMNKLPKMSNNRHKGELSLVIAHILIQKADYLGAIDILEECQNIFTRIYNRKVHFSNIEVYLKLGEAYLGLGDGKHARESFEEASRLYQTYVNERNENPRPQVAAQIELALARAHKLAGDLSQSLTHINSSRNILKQRYPEGHPDLLKGYLMESELNLSQANFKLARELCQDAENILAPYMKNSLISLELEHQKAKVFYSKAKQSPSIENYQLAAAAFDQVIAELRDFQSSLHHSGSVSIWQGRMIQIFEQAMAVNHQLLSLSGEQDEARTFRIMEQYRAATVRRALIESQAKKIAGVPDKLLTRESNLQREISICKQMLYHTRQGNSLSDSLQRIITDRTEQLISLSDTIRKQASKYYSLKYEEELVDLEDFQRYLQENKSLAIEYLLGEKDIYYLAISPDQVKSIRIAREKVKEALDFFEREFGEIQNSSPSAASTYSTFSYGLYETLLKESLESLSHSNNRLLIIPDRSLFSIPFAALATEEQKKTDGSFDGLSYLFEEYAISYGLSASILLEQENKQNLDQSVLAFAPDFGGLDTLPLSAYFAEGQTSDWRQSDYQLFRKQGALKYNMDEAIDIVSQVGGKAYTGSEAVKDSFLQTYKSYSILHLATHTQMDSLPASLHNIQFSERNDRHPVDDLLLTSEVYALDLHLSSLVVLSACNTAMGTLKKGEGALSLARAFQQAGSASIVASLWEVNDKSSHDIMLGFYENLEKGMEKDYALAKSMKSYLNNHPHQSPRNWAAFISMGSQDVLPIENPGLAWWIWILVACAGVIIISFINRYFT